MPNQEFSIANWENRKHLNKNCSLENSIVSMLMHWFGNYIELM